jgi:HEAT repeat protein
MANAQQTASGNGEDEKEIFHEECHKFTFETLLVELRHESSSSRWLAADCLGELKDSRAVEPLIQAILKENFPRIKMIEADALKALGDAHADDLLLTAMLDKDTEESAIYALGRLQSKRAIEPLIRVSRSSDRVMAGVATDALAQIKDPRSFQPIREVLRSRDEVLRRYAAIDLGFLDDPRAVGPLISALHDPDEGVRENAADSLGRYKSTDAERPLIAALKDEYEGVRAAAVDSLAETGDARVVPALIAAMTSGTDRVRWHAGNALVKFNTPEASQALDDALQKDRLDIIAAAYRYFLAKGNAESIDAMAVSMPKYGWYEMADALLHCGNTRLEEAASQWKKENEFEIEP